MLQKRVIIFLHFFGGSDATWLETIEQITLPAEKLVLSLHGFGDAAHHGPKGLQEHVDYIRTVADLDGADELVLVGHSMGAKIATIFAYQMAKAYATQSPITKLVLISGSPPSPEPMGEEQRREMLSWFNGTPSESQKQAESYINGNVAHPLPQQLHQRTVDDVLKATRRAWQDWLENGSKEDWSRTIGILTLPTLIIAGAQDDNLGPDSQRSLMAPHFTNFQLVIFDDCAHLIPLEAPARLARLIDNFLEMPVSIHAKPSGTAAFPSSYEDLLQSDRVTSRTRQVLQDRMDCVPLNLEAAAISALEFALLCAVINQLLPGQRARGFAIAELVVSALAHSDGDGWRYAELPPDAAAVRLGLKTLDELARQPKYGGRPFICSNDGAQHKLLQHCASGHVSPGSTSAFSAEQMSLWFEELAALAVRLWLSQPAAMASIGYSGFSATGVANGQSGYRQVGLDEVEPWEPTRHNKPMNEAAL